MYRTTLATVSIITVVIIGQQMTTCEQTLSDPYGKDINFFVDYYFWWSIKWVFYSLLFYFFMSLSLYKHLYIQLLWPHSKILIGTVNICNILYWYIRSVYKCIVQNTLLTIMHIIYLLQYYHYYLRSTDVWLTLQLQYHYYRTYRHCCCCCCWVLVVAPNYR